MHFQYSIAINIAFVTRVSVGEGCRQHATERPAVSHIEVGVVNDDVEPIGSAVSADISDDVDDGVQTGLVLSGTDTDRRTSRIRHQVVMGHDELTAATTINAFTILTHS